MALTTRYTTTALPGRVPVGALAEASVTTVSLKDRSLMLFEGIQPSRRRCTGLNRRQPSATVVGSDTSTVESDNPSLFSSTMATCSPSKRPTRRSQAKGLSVRTNPLQMVASQPVGVVSGLLSKVLQEPPPAADGSRNILKVYCTWSTPCCERLPSAQLAHVAVTQPEVLVEWEMFRSMMRELARSSTNAPPLLSSRAPATLWVPVKSRLSTHAVEHAGWTRAWVLERNTSRTTRAVLLPARETAARRRE